MTSPVAGNQGVWSRISPRAVIAVLLAVLALVVILQNTRRTRFDLLFWTMTAPGWIWLLTLFVAGGLVGSIFPWFRRRSKR